MTHTLHMGPAAAEAAAICLVVHGRGQTQDDMVQSIVSRLDAPRVHVVLPKSDGPGWYAARAVDPLTDVSRAELAASLAALDATVQAARAAAPGLPLVLAGFSQGACLIAEYLMTRGPVTAAAMFTGCRVGARSDNLPITGLRGMPAYLSGGDADPWIPYPACLELASDLVAAGARLRADIFPGRAHEVAGAEIATLQQMLDDVMAGRALLAGAA